LSWEEYFSELVIHEIFELSLQLGIIKLENQKNPKENIFYRALCLAYEKNPEIFKQDPKTWDFTKKGD